MSHDPDREPILYTQSGCADSPKVRAWLTEHGVAFTERPVADQETAEELAATGIFATPLLVLGSTQVLGFHPELLTTVIDAHATSCGKRGIPSHSGGGAGGAR